MMLSGLGVTVPNAIAFGPAGAVYDGVSDVWNFFSTPSIASPPSPAFSAPIAPQTESAMRSWTPDQQAEAYAQKGNQYTADTSYFSSLLQGGTGANASGSNVIPPVNPDAKPSNTLMWVLAGVAGVLFLTTITKR